MSKLIKTKDQIVMKRNTVFLGIGVFSILMAASGVRLLFQILPFEQDYTFADVLGLLLMCAWISLVLSMGLFALKTNSNQITIDRKGILCESWLRKELISWDEIKDWGLSYCGQTRGEGNTYYLYFSRHECSVINECKKRLKGKMVKTFVMGSGYSEAVSSIIPFCSENTDIQPFIGKDKYHFF